MKLSVYYSKVYIIGSYLSIMLILVQNNTYCLLLFCKQRVWFYNYISVYSACVQSCPVDTREYHSLCLQCDANCKSCTTVVDKELCQTCKDGYLMIEGENRCLTSCPEGYFRGKIQSKVI